MEVDFDDEPIIISIKGDPAANLMVKAEEVAVDEAAPSLKTCKLHERLGYDSFKTGLLTIQRYTKC